MAPPPTTTVYTHVESVGLGPHVAIVAGDRGFGDAPGCQQMFVDVILPGRHVEESKGGCLCVVY